MGIHIKEGYCEESSRTTSRVISWTSCSNKSKYKVTLENNKIINVCGTHLRSFYKEDWNFKPIKGEYVDHVLKVEEIKTGKVIYEKN